jgi:HEAT repeat protein
MNNGHRYVRRGIIQALGQIGGSVASNKIIESLNDREWGVRMYAAEALGNIGKAKYADYLEKLLDDKHEWPREEARKALEKLN